MTTSSPLVEAMGHAGYRVTEPRRVVADLVASRQGHFTAADLIDEAHARDIDVGRATIFRSLELFTALGVLERIDLPTGDHAYVACEPQVHHHHVVCEVCGRVADIDDMGLAAAVERIQRRSGWQIRTHRLELYGRCPACRDRRAS